jgi:hypothetical protein
MALLAGPGLALAAEPPGSLVIRPGGSGAKPVERYPEKAGFLVIRPASSVTAPDRTTSSPTLIGRSPAAPKNARLLPAPTSTRSKQLPDSKDDGKTVIETWDATFLRGQRVGYTHVVVREYERDGKTFLYGIKTQKMTVARFGQVVEQWGEDSTLESADGQVLTTRMRQGLGREQKLSLAGKVKGNVLTVEIEGAAGGTQDVPFPDGVLGIAREATLLKDRKPKVGDVIDYLWYEGRLNRVVKFTATIKGVEELALYEGLKPRNYLRVEVAMEPLRDQDGREFKLPSSTVWADAETLEPLKMEAEMPSFGGKLTVIRTTKEAALMPPGRVPDLFDVQSIRLDRPIPNVHDQTSVTYRVKLSGDLDPEKAFVRDGRQAVENLDAAAKAFDLTVRAGRPGVQGEKAVPAGKEFLSSNFFIDWDNEAVRVLAQQAVAALPPTANEWQKARAVEAWVHRNMKPAEFSQAMATCSNVAKSLSGDCTEYAMLAAGMCRALEVPSRTALGVVYANGRDGKPYLAYHMWFEVYAEGRWTALDATLGRSGIGPGHIKITDSSWHDEKSFAPLLPVLTVLSAQPKVEVLRVTGAGR